MEQVLQYLYIFVAVAAFFVSAAFLVQLARLPEARTSLIVGLGALVFIPSASGKSLLAFALGCGAGVGIVLSSNRYWVRRAYVLSIALVIALVLLDFVYDSGIARFGLPSLQQLFDPQLVWCSVFEASIGSLAVAVTAIGLFKLFWWFGGISPARGKAHAVARRRLIAFSLTSVILYLVEPQFHRILVHPLGVYHPYVVHHPYTALSTLAGGLAGYFALRKYTGVLEIFDAANRLVYSVAVYFSAYHFGIDVYERTAGWMFDAPYTEMVALAFVWTLPYGVLLRQLVLEKRATRL